MSCAMLLLAAHAGCQASMRRPQAADAHGLPSAFLIRRNASSFIMPTADFEGWRA